MKEERKESTVKLFQVLSLNKYCMPKRNENLLKMVNEFNENLQTGFDIRTHDKNKETEL